MSVLDDYLAREVKKRGITAKNFTEKTGLSEEVPYVDFMKWLKKDDPKSILWEIPETYYNTMKDFNFHQDGINKQLEKLLTAPLAEVGT